MAEESKKIQERAKQGIWRAEREGRRASGLINYGMEWVPKKDNPEVKEWRVNRKELAALKEIRRLVLAGVDTTEIARIFNADLENYPTKYAAKWTAGNVSAKFQSDFLFTRERTVKTGPDTWRNSKIVRAPFFTKAQVMEVRHLLRQKRLCHGRAGPIPFAPLGRVQLWGGENLCAGFCAAGEALPVLQVQGMWPEAGR